MLNILSCVGMNMQSEVCLWTLLGLMRTIFDATLFKVNANLKQVWQMSMPAELSMPVQRVLRTMISGIMLVQCFTVYVYLASYIVLLYPVFLEERPTLVLPWLLLAAIRKLLCELTSLAMGLGTCVLLGPAKPPCIRFLVAKFATIMPAFYKWILVYSYYTALKVATAYKTFPIVVPPNGLDYGLELAVRRRCTKSLFGEEQLRKKLKAGFYAEKPPTININITPRAKVDDTVSIKNVSGSDVCNEETPQDSDGLRPLSTVSNKLIDIGAYEDWFGSEIMVPRGDRILEQFVVMLLRIAAYLKRDGTDSISSKMFNSDITATWATREHIGAMPADVTDTPPLVGNSRGYTASYLRNYPQIFMKKFNTDAPQTHRNMSQTTNTDSAMIKSRLRTLSSISNKSYESHEMTVLENKKIVSDTIINLSGKNSSSTDISEKLKSNEEASDKVILPARERSSCSSRESIDIRAEAVQDIKNIINIIRDNFLPQSPNPSNITSQNLNIEPKLEKDVTSCNVIDADEFMLPKIKDVTQCCSECVTCASFMPVQPITAKTRQDEEIEASSNIDSRQLSVVENKESKVFDNSNFENKQTVDAISTSTSCLETTNPTQINTSKLKDNVPPR